MRYAEGLVPGRFGVSDSSTRSLQYRRILAMRKSEPRTQVSARRPQAHPSG